MRASGCPYLQCEKTAVRESLNVSGAAPVSITATWYCRHPFHGIRVELGAIAGDVEKLCACCALPRQTPQEDDG